MGNELRRLSLLTPVIFLIVNLKARFHRTVIWGAVFSALVLLTTANVSTLAQSGCYPHDTAFVLGNMNIRQSASIDSPVVATAGSGDAFTVSQSQHGDRWCWLSISEGWMAKTSRVSATRPSAAAWSQAILTSQTVAEQSEVDNCCFVGWQCNSDEGWRSGYWAFQHDQCDSPSQWPGRWSQMQRQHNPYPVKVTTDYITGVTTFEYEDGVEIIARLPTQQEFCDALERDGQPLPPECEDL